MNKPAILCVDDEKMILESLQEQLSRGLGDAYQIEIAESGEEALEIVRDFIEENTEVPVVISDQLMPSMKGDELLSRIGDLVPGAARILLTGQADEAALEKARQNGLLTMDKPWDKENLLESIKKLLGHG